MSPYSALLFTLTWNGEPAICTNGPDCDGPISTLMEKAPSNGATYDTCAKKTGVRGMWVERPSRQLVVA